jgi:hypothetical protein
MRALFLLHSAMSAAILLAACEATGPGALE